MGKLAYRLDLSLLMKMYSVVSVAQLELARSTPDLYKRAQQPPPPVEEDGLTDLYEIETLLDKRITGRGKIQYLVKWKDCGNEYNAWYDVEDLTRARDLIEEYEQRE